MSTDNNEIIGFFSKTFEDFLSEKITPRSEIDFTKLFSFFCFDFCDNTIERFRSENRTRKSSIWPIIRATSVTNRVICKIIEIKFNKTPFPSTPHDTRTQVRSEKFWKEGNDMKFHLRIYFIDLISTSNVRVFPASSCPAAIVTLSFVMATIFTVFPPAIHSIPTSIFFP